MKPIIFILLSSFGIAQVSDEKELYPFSFGAGIYGKASTNAVVQPEARKTDFIFNNVPDFMLNAYLPYSSTNDIGLFTEMGFNNHQFFTEDANNGENYTSSINYFSIAPYLYMEDFLIGFSISVPIAADYGLPSGTALPNDEVSELERLNNLFELRLGYIYTLYEDYNGRLNISILASYSMNGLFNNYEENDPYKELIIQPEDYRVTEVFNPRIASINIGISYFFYLEL